MNDLLPIAERIARCYAARFARRLPSHLDRDDFVSVALLAAWQAQETYQPGRASLKSWVSGKIWKALVQHLRSEDHLTRGQRRKFAEEAPVEYQLPAWLDGPISDGEGVTFAEVVRDPVSQVGRDGLTDNLRRREVVALVERLRPNLKEIVFRHFWLGETGEQSAKALGCCESRAHQLKREALIRLREKAEGRL